jgi:hypothetical protein
MKVRITNKGIGLGFHANRECSMEACEKAYKKLERIADDLSKKESTNIYIRTAVKDDSIATIRACVTGE